MKQICIFIATLSLLFNFSSCSKDELKGDNLSTEETQSTILTKAAGGNLERLYSYKEWYYDWTCNCMTPVYVWIFCQLPSRNCLPEVVITDGSSTVEKNEVDQFLSNYQNSTLDSYFSTSGYSNVFPVIDSISGVVDSIISKDIVIHKFYNSHDSTDYYIGLRKGIQITDDWDEWVPEASCVLRLNDQR